MTDVSYDDLCNMIALNVSQGSPKIADKYLVGLYKVILRQLELNQRIFIKDFGYFEIKPRKSGERVIYDMNTNEKKLIYVEPKYSIFFKASENFDFAVNENDFNMVTDSKIKQLKKMKSHRKSRITNFVDLLNKAEDNKEIIWRNGKATNKKK